MKRYFGYVRVSTQRQGVHGVSLQEQRAAIDAYAKRNNLSIIGWYEERETAAKQGRNVFAKMLKELIADKADGIILHKIDRGARNLRDWADLAELIDRKKEVRFAHDDLDLSSRGGRLSADIQAVVAADFIRNLREETRKGFYGRLKQGLYPIQAPNGYRDMGRGKLKEIDAVQGPLVRQAFELYSTGEWNFETLLAEMTHRGLRSRRGTALSLNGLSVMLNNPFYMGLIHIRRTGELFEGKHVPLITKKLYDRVQAVMRGRRTGAMPLRHDFLFRRMLTCGHCGSVLVGERHKGRYVYYRCHRAGCKVTTVPEVTMDNTFKALFSALRLGMRGRGDEICDGDVGEIGEMRDFRDMVEDIRVRSGDERARRESALRLLITQCEERLARLTDALIDNLIDKPTFEARKTQLLDEKRGYADQLEETANGPSVADVIDEFLELANTAEHSYETGNVPEKRDVVAAITSNSSVRGKEPAITLKSPYREMLEMQNPRCCDAERGHSRIDTQALFDILMKAAKEKIGKHQFTDEHTSPQANIAEAA